MTTPPRFAIGATTRTSHMPAHLTGITDLATLSAACLSAQAPGITMDGLAIAGGDTAAADMPGDVAAMAAADTLTAAVDLPMARVAVMGTATAMAMADVASSAGTAVATWAADNPLMAAVAT